MAKRLFTFGCSFTRYYWPTWADMLGREYDEFENWGNGGLGNRAIIERLTECIMNNTITADDTIIVQWSEHHRFDIHMPQPYLPEGWAQGGNMLSAHDFEKSWISSVWNEKSYVMHSLNFISMAVMILESLPCKWYMTSINDIKKDAIAQGPEFQNYLKIFDHPNFLKPMNDFFDQYEFPKKSLIDTDKTTLVDYHPIPIAHYGWLTEILSPLLDKNVEEQWAIDATTVLFDKCKYYIFLRDNFKKNLGWDSREHWVLGVVDSDYATIKSLQ